MASQTSKHEQAVQDAAQEREQTEEEMQKMRLESAATSEAHQTAKRRLTTQLAELQEQVGEASAEQARLTEALELASK